MKALILFQFLLPFQFAQAGGGATGSNEDLLIAFLAFLLASGLGVAIPRFTRYLVQRYHIYRKN